MEVSVLCRRPKKSSERHASSRKRNSGAQGTENLEKSGIKSEKQKNSLKKSSNTQKKEIIPYSTYSYNVPSTMTELSAEFINQLMTLNYTDHERSKLPHERENVTQSIHQCTNKPYVIGEGHSRAYDSNPHSLDCSKKAEKVPIESSLASAYNNVSYPNIPDAQNEKKNTKKKLKKKEEVILDSNTNTTTVPTMSTLGAAGHVPCTSSTLFTANSVNSSMSVKSESPKLNLKYEYLIQGSPRIENRLISSRIVKEELLGEIPMDFETNEVKEIIKEVKLASRHLKPSKKKKHTEKMIERKPVQHLYVKRYVEVPKIEEKVTTVSVPMIIDIPKETIRVVKKQKEKIFIEDEEEADVYDEPDENDGNITAIGRQQLYHHQQIPVVVSQVNQPEITESERNPLRVEVKRVNPKLVPIDVYVPKLIMRPCYPTTRHDRHVSVPAPSSHYNALVQSLNSHIMPRNEDMSAVEELYIHDSYLDPVPLVHNAHIPYVIQKLSSFENQPVHQILNNNQYLPRKSDHNITLIDNPAIEPPTFFQEQMQPKHQQQYISTKIETGCNTGHIAVDGNQDNTVPPQYFLNKRSACHDSGALPPNEKLNSQSLYNTAQQHHHTLEDNSLLDCRTDKAAKNTITNKDHCYDGYPKNKKDYPNDDSNILIPNTSQIIQEQNTELEQKSPLLENKLLLEKNEPDQQYPRHFSEKEQRIKKTHSGSDDAVGCTNLKNRRPYASYDRVYIGEDVPTKKQPKTFVARIDLMPSYTLKSPEDLTPHTDNDTSSSDSYEEDYNQQQELFNCNKNQHDSTIFLNKLKLPLTSIESLSKNHVNKLNKSLEDVKDLNENHIFSPSSYSYEEQHSKSKACCEDPTSTWYPMVVVEKDLDYNNRFDKTEVNNHMDNRSCGSRHSITNNEWNLTHTNANETVPLQISTTLTDSTSSVSSTSPAQTHQLRDVFSYPSVILNENPVSILNNSIVEINNHDDDNISVDSELTDTTYPTVLSTVDIEDNTDLIPRAEEETEEIATVCTEATTITDSPEIMVVLDSSRVEPHSSIYPKTDDNEEL